MYAIRRWSSAHARQLERVYKATRPIILAGLRIVTRLFGRRFDTPITAAEHLVKGVLFDCQMCGDCVLSNTGMTCPMNCPKSIRNGPCGGVRANGMCEVKPDMHCVWVDAWNGASIMEDGDMIKELEFAVDHNRIGRSSWLRLARDE